MLKVRNRVLMVVALTISAWPMFANAGVSDADFAKEKSVVAVNNQEQEDYDTAYNFVKTNDFAKAQSLFTQFIKKYPNSSLVANCYYWKGKMFFKDRKFEEAKENFLNVIKYKTTVENVAESAFHVGEIYEYQGDIEKASKYYRLILNSYPGTFEYQHAQIKLEELLLCSKSVIEF